MPRSGLCIHRVSGSSIAWFSAALLTAFVWAPSAYCQATYVVNEPPAPQASKAVATLLAEGERLHQAMQHEEALQAADRALAAALEAGDLAGEALSHSAQAAALVELGLKVEAVAAWQAAAGAWERANEGQGQIEPLVSAALDLLAIDGQQARQLLARALRVGKVERQRRFATADTLQRSGMRLQAFELSRLATAEDARAFLSAADALRHEATVGKLLDEDQYAEAEAVARHRLTEVEATSGPDSLDTADALDVLAGALFVVKTSEIPAKRQLAERALAIREKFLGPEHFEVAQSLYTLGRVLWQAGEYREARLQ